MNQVATDFLTRCFAPCETIALLLRRDNTSRPQQRVITVEQAITSRYMAWLTYASEHGANIYVSANPLRPGSRKRTKECVASVRNLYIDIDEDGDVRLGALRASERVPAPTAILSTSPGKYQALWRVARFDFERQEQTLKLLAIVFGGDPACTDRNRVLRLPGFYNWKYSPAHLVAVEYPSNKTSVPSDFHLDEATAATSMLPHQDASAAAAPKHSPSEEDWAWVCSQLACGADAAKLTRELALRRTDKADPSYYSQRTVDMASARLWLLEGATIDDVITMLEIRRRFEIPAALCSSRAREIAVTAQRMIVRKKSA